MCEVSLLSPSVNSGLPSHSQCLHKAPVGPKDHGTRVQVLSVAGRWLVAGLKCTSEERLLSKCDVHFADPFAL